MTAGILHTITGPADVHALPEDQLEPLCAEIRKTLIAYSHTHGGHIGSNLGLVEATVALHRVFDSPADRIIFDVSHQSYVHKMLTGRAEAYLNPALHDSVTGFTNPQESEHDQFTLGHTGTSISLACGLAKARDLQHGSSSINNVIAVIGDGALSSAIAFEGLNNAAQQGGNLIIVVNDNEMSIAEDFGGMYGSLAKLRTSNGTAQPNLFEAFGLDYRYVEHGNDVNELIAAFAAVKNIDHPIVVHIHTTKGLGLGPSDAADEGRCEANHWIDADAMQGRLPGARKYYGQLAMQELEARFASEPGLVVVSPATPGSNGITRDFRQRAGEHYVDVGITEEHAVAFASGIAKAGGRPAVATSSTFFQRTFDQLQQELSLNVNPVTLLSFGSGISAADNTHSGAFDIPLFSNIPGLTCLAPTSGRMFLDMLNWSTSEANHSPVVIQVPGERILAYERAAGAQDAANGEYDDSSTLPPTDADVCPWQRYDVVRRGADVAIFGLGNMLPLAYDAADMLADMSEDDSTAPIHATIVDPHQFSTLDKPTLEALYADHQLVVTLEDGQLEGGWGAKIAVYYGNHDEASSGHHMRTLCFGADKEFTDRVPAAKLCERYGLTPEQIAARIREALRS